MNEIQSECRACFGKGWNDVWHRNKDHYDGGELSRQTCEECDGKGFEALLKDAQTKLSEGPERKQ